MISGLTPSFALIDQFTAALLILESRIHSKSDVLCRVSFVRTTVQAWMQISGTMEEIIKLVGVTLVACLRSMPGLSFRILWLHELCLWSFALSSPHQIKLFLLMLLHC